MAPASARLLTLAITASALPYSLSAHQACLDRPVDQWLFRGNEKDTRAAGGDHADAACLGHLLRRQPSVQPAAILGRALTSEEHTTEFQSLMRTPYAAYCL